MSRATKTRSGNIPDRWHENKHSSARQTQDNSSPETTPSAPARWPELRIIRPVNYEVLDAFVWVNFLNDVGSRNYGLGTARSMGSMACSLVDAQAMGRMMAKKFNKIASDRRKFTQVQRTFARNFNQFVRSQEIERATSDFEKLAAPQLLGGGMVAVDDELILSPVEEITDAPHTDDIYLGDGLFLPDHIASIQWDYGDFAVKAIDAYGGNDLGLDLSGNERLYSEFHETVDYLKHEGLDTNLMRGPADGFLYKPHVSIFETFGRAETVDLQYKYSLPDSISLNPPYAQTNK